MNWQLKESLLYSTSLITLWCRQNSFDLIKLYILVNVIFLDFYNVSFVYYIEKSAESTYAKMNFNKIYMFLDRNVTFYNYCHFKFVKLNLNNFVLYLPYLHPIKYVLNKITEKSKVIFTDLLRYKVRPQLINHKFNTILMYFFLAHKFSSHFVNFVELL